MTAKDESLYVRVENPTAVRRSLLESSKKLINLLQKNERIIERKNSKKQLRNELKDHMTEINHLFTTLRSKLPKIKSSTLPKKQKQVASPDVTPEPKVETPRPKRISEQHKLEQELADIEAKLNKL